MNTPSFNPEKNYLVYVLDMSEAIGRIASYCRGVDEVVFSHDTQLQDAVIRCFQIIGEAAGKMPEALRTQFPKIPWRKIVALRNLIIHDYANVAYDEVWRVIQEDLPELRENIEHMKGALDKNKENQNKL